MTQNVLFYPGTTPCSGSGRQFPATSCSVWEELLVLEWIAGIVIGCLHGHAPMRLTTLKISMRGYEMETLCMSTQYQCARALLVHE